ncbi:hypothetical protein [Microbacterium sp. 18062]|uniref:hypothetical protein n=1 Tax=Microbacterium sp. 18062 TaxID=2681410 RepID=UPI001357BF34|nr:hypothetical protein [Microbacterium sp. 18062]
MTDHLDRRTGRKNSIRWRAAAGIVGVFLWIAAPVVAVSLVAMHLTTADVLMEEDTWTAPEPSTGDRDRQVGLELTWAPSQTIVAPAWTGVVQAVHVTAGDTIESGQRLALIGGVDRIAVHTEVPFTRALVRGDTGSDVTALNNMLAALGYDSGGPDEFTWSTLFGVRELAAAIGVSSASEVAAFDPGWVVYLPADSAAIDAIALQVGAPAPAAGVEILTTPATIASVTLVSADQVPTGSGDAAQQTLGLEPTAAAPAERLYISATELPLQEDRARVDPSAFEQARSQVAAGTAYTLAILRQPVPEGEYRVPASAIITDADGSTCVIASTAAADAAPASSVTSVAVTVTASDAGSSWVAGDVTRSDLIASTPRDGLRSCHL